MKKTISLFVILATALQCFSQTYSRKDLDKQTADYPFYLGAQYHRTPTPAKENWDHEKERFVDDVAANALLSTPMRAPWSLS